MAVNSFREDEKSSGVSNTVTLKRLLSYLLAYKKQIIIVLLIMAYASTVSLINPLIMESAIDNHIQSGDFKGLLHLAILAIILNGTMVLLIRFRMYMMAGVCNKVLLTIRQELYTHIQTLDFHFFDSRPNGKILSRIIGDINSLKDVLNNFVTTLLPDAVTVIAVVIIMFIKNPRLAAASLISIPIMAIGIWVIQVKAHKRWLIFRKKSSNLNAYIHEDMSGIRIIQSFTAEPETRTTFKGLLKEHRDSFMDAVRIADGFNSVIDFCWGLGSISMFYVGIAVLGIGTKQVGLLIAFSSYISMFWNPIMNLSNFYNQLITNIAGAERVFEIMDTPSEITNGNDVAEMPPINGDVTFDHVSFSYDDKTKVLDDVTFHINPGETIALVGPTGAGKTTIVSLISRFYDVQNGCVMIDGKDVRNVTIESLRSQMGIMTQDSFLFTGTVKENIRYGKLDATDEEVIAAAKAVNAHDFIMQLKDGYDTELSERGGGLSIGQKQLLAFARTMISMPKILILDEATSSIDTQTELLVQKGIDALLKGRTSFVVAHRLSTIRKANRIFVVDNAHIIEEGSHDELLAKKGAYYRLYMAQFSHALGVSQDIDNAAGM